MRLRTVVISLGVLWLTVLFSLLVAFYLWIRDPRSQLSMTLIEITSWAFAGVSIILIPLPFVILITQRKVGAYLT